MTSQFREKTVTQHQSSHHSTKIVFFTLRDREHLLVTLREEQMDVSWLRLETSAKGLLWEHFFLLPAITTPG